MTKTNFLCALVALSALATVAGCAAEPDVAEQIDEDVAESTASALTTKAPTPFCLPGEVVKCTLGPPPVCRCEPVNPPILQSYVAR